MNPDQNLPVPEPTPVPPVISAPPPGPIPPAQPVAPVAPAQAVGPIPPAQPAASAVPPSQDMVTPPPMPQSTVIVGSQLPASYTKQRKSYKSLIIKIVIGLVVVIGILGILIATNIIALGTFRTVKYDNGKGSQYSLKFYSKHSVKSVPKDSSDYSTTSGDLKELVSKVEVNGMAPLTAWFESSPKSTSRDCTQTGLQKAFEVNIKGNNQAVPVCVVSQDGKDIVYLAAFSSGGKGTIAFISQDVDFNKLTSSPENARAGLKKVGLSDYQDDVKTILESVKLLN